MVIDQSKVSAGHVGRQAMAVLTQECDNRKRRDQVGRIGRAATTRRPIKSVAPGTT